MITGAAPVPSGFYPTRISTKLAWIYSVTDSLGDLDHDGQPNLLEYGLRAQPLIPDAAKLPQVALEGTFVERAKRLKPRSRATTPQNYSCACALRAPNESAYIRPRRR